jgi:hypothetical protein
MKNLVFLTCVSMLLAGVALAQETPEVSGEDDLEKVKGPFAGTFVNPDADITRYDKLYAWKTVIQFRDVGDAKSMESTAAVMRDSTGVFAVNEEDRAKFGKIVSEAIVKELGRSKKFELVDEIGPGVLLMRGAFLDVISTVPPSRAGLVDVYLTSVGEATMVFELIDSETGVIQARVGERRRIQPPGATMNQVAAMPSTSATIWADVNQWASKVAYDLRVALDRAKKKADKKK